MREPCERCNFYFTCMQNLNDSEMQEDLIRRKTKERLPFTFLNPISRKRYFEKHRFSLRLWNRDCFVLPETWRKIINIHI